MAEVKLCECGCGQPTPPSKSHFPKRGYIKGQPLRFIPGHGMRGRKWSEEMRQRWSAARLGHGVSEETRRKISENHRAKGIRPSAEAIRKSNENRPQGPDSPFWKGGVTFTSGYRCVYLPDHHRAHPNGYVYEHIVIAEAKLGRSLVPGEVVHHVDGNKRNNDPDNLQVLESQSEHIRRHRTQGDII